MRSEKQQRGQQETHPGIDVWQGIESHSAEGIRRIVALLKGGDGVSILVRDHRENQHWKREDEVADLRFQGSVLSVGTAEG